MSITLCFSIIICIIFVSFYVGEQYHSFYALSQEAKTDSRNITASLSDDQIDKESNSMNNDGGITNIVITTIASISAAILAGFFGVLNQRKISSLEISKIKENARTTYEYEAKKRLYEQSGPILFQFVETSDLALNRITGIAGSIRYGKLEPYSGWLSNTDNYYLKNTIYRLMAPMAAFRLLQSQLTLVDLSLDSYIHIQYQIAKGVYRTFSDDYALAGSGSTLPYSPPDEGKTNKEKEEMKSNPAKYKRQSIFAGILDRLANDLIICDAHTKVSRVMMYGEFEDKYFGKDAGWKNKEELVTIVRLLLNFHPRTQPILWRMLITQAILYTALKDIRENALPPYIKPLELMTHEQKKHFDWRKNPAEAKDDEVFDVVFKAAHDYIQTYLGKLCDQLLNGIK